VTQSQSNNLGSPPNSTPSLIVFNSIYENTQDSSGNEIRIRFFNLFKDNQSRFNIDTLQKVLEIEDSNLNSEYSFPDISFRICQKTYSLEIYQGLGF